MALYHFSVRHVSRGKGQMVVASAAYISGQRIFDSYYNKIHDYTSKSGVIFTEILTPEYVPERLNDRETLWNEVEHVERNNKAQLAKQSSHVRANEEIIQLQKEKIKQQDTEFANNSDRIFKQGDLIEEQKNQLEKLTLEIDDIESLLQDVSDVAYEKAVEEVTNEVMIKTRQDDIQLIEGTKNWIDQPQRKASEKEKNYAKNRLDGVIKKIMKAMTAVQTVKDSLLQPKTKVKVVNEIKEKARPSIMSRLAEKKKELAEREANKKNDLKKSWNRDDR